MENLNNNQYQLDDEERKIIRKEKIEYYTDMYRNEVKLAMSEIKATIYRTEHTRKAISAVRQLNRLNVRLNEKGIKFLEECVIHDQDRDFVENVQLVVDLHLKNKEEGKALKFVNTAIATERKHSLDYRLKNIKEKVESISLERDVMLFLEEGRTTSQIADRLGKSEIEIIRMRNKFQAREKQEENER